LPDLSSSLELSTVNNNDDKKDVSNDVKDAPRKTGVMGVLYRVLGWK
jgi:hypothetical protein